ncbi:hypothetical protein AAVH_34933 [Aphelenchoides avenae]|nr:hypothetical protein AAVH_34933 [Aphelenchus avenae]
MDFLRPKAFHLFVDGSSWSEDDSHRELQHQLSRESLRNSIQTCILFAGTNAPPPVKWILGATGYRNYEVHDFINGGCFPANWFDSFIDSFVRGECVNEKLESVLVVWLFKGETSGMPKRLRKQSESDVRIPRDNLIMRRISDKYQVTQCDLFSFTSTDRNGS